MTHRLVHRSQGQRIVSMVFDMGDEPISLLTQFALDNQVTAAQFTAIGAFSDAMLRWFDWQTQEDKKIPVEGQVEVLVLAGDITLKDDGQPNVRAHVVLGKSDGSALAGDLSEAHVWPTLELILAETPLYPQRRHEPKRKLALWAPIS